MAAPQMMVGALEGRFLEMLVFALQPQLVLEIGMFTGYSSLSMAAALPPGGRIVTCDVDPKAEEMARRHIEASPYSDRIEIRMGPALDTITEPRGPVRPRVHRRGQDELPQLLRRDVLPLLADDGMIAADNVLWSGQVLDEAEGQLRQHRGPPRLQRLRERRRPQVNA